MPTVSAAEALDDLQSPNGKDGKKKISTGLMGLDAALCGRRTLLAEEKPGGGPGDAAVGGGGVERGKVTEVYGPPGVGKTVFG